MGRPAPLDGELDRLTAEVLASAKYRALDPELVRWVGARSLTSHRGYKEALKATKNSLHQAYGAFQAARPRYSAWLEEAREALGTAPACPLSRIEDAPPAFAALLLRLMAQHASTAERAAILPEFYGSLLADLSPPERVLDLGCGLHPLAIPWMGLPPGVRYRCYDIDADQVAFLNHFFALIGVDGRAEVRDLVAAPPAEPADLAFALKLLPTLDGLRRDAGMTLLRAVEVPCLAVSFPARSLGGRETGLALQHAARFGAQLDAEGWPSRRHDFAGELAFVVRKGLARTPQMGHAENARGGVV